MPRELASDEWLFVLAACRHGGLEVRHLVAFLSGLDAGLPPEQQLVHAGLLTRSARGVIRRRVEELASASGGAEGALWELIREDAWQDTLPRELPAEFRPQFETLCRKLGAQFGDSTAECRDWRYVVRDLKFHAKGGMGVVSTAADVALQRQVAVKELAARLVADPEARQRFLCEAQVTGMLEHPGVVPIYALGRHADGRPFYTMRFVRGTTLRQAIDELHNANLRAHALFHSPTFRRVLRHFVDVCNTVEYAHSRGIVHRDLKPDNIMLGQFGETLVLDWGLARSYHGAAERAAAHGPQTPTDRGHGIPEFPETVCGQMLGTLMFASPEQLRGEHDRLGPAADVYSLGVILHLVVTGQMPRRTEAKEDALTAALRGHYLPLRRVNHHVPPALAAVCHKAMAVHAQDRYASARDLADDIERWRSLEAVQAHRESLGERLGRWMRKNRRWAVSASVSLLGITLASAVAAIVAMSFWKDAREQRDLALHHAELTERGLYNTQLKLVEELCPRSPYEARQLLHDEHRCPLELREFTWGYLEGLLSRMGGGARMQHAGITDMAVSADGQRIFSAGESREVLAWNVATSQVLETYPVRATGCGAVACTPSAKAVAFALEETRVRLVLLDAALSPLDSEPVGSPVVAMAFSPHEQLLAVGTAAGSVLVHDWSTLGLRAPRVIASAGEAAGVLALEFLGGEELLCARWSNDPTRVRILPSRSEQPHEAGELLSLPDEVTLQACARHAPVLVSWSRARSAIRVWERQPAGDPQMVLRAEIPAGDLTALAVSYDGRTVAYADASHAINVWEDGHRTAAFTTCRTDITQLRFTGDPRMLVSADRDGVIHSWKIDDSQGSNVGRNGHRGIQPSRVIQESQSVWSLASSADRHLLAVGGDGVVGIWNTHTWTRLRDATVHDHAVNAIAVSPDSRWLASRCDYGVLIVWNLDTNEQVAHWQSWDCDSFHFAQRQPALWLCLRDGSVRRWDFLQQPDLDSTSHLQPWIASSVDAKNARRIPLGNDDKWLTYVPDSDQLHIVDVSDGRSSFPITVNGSIRSRRNSPVPASPQGTYLAVETTDAWEVWNLVNRERTLLTAKEPQTDYFLRFSPDGRTLVSVLSRAADEERADTRLVFWDPVTGHQRLAQEVDAAQVQAVEFLGDGSALLMADGNGRLLAWDSVPSPALQESEPGNSAPARSDHGSTASQNSP